MFAEKLVESFDSWEGEIVVEEFGHHFFFEGRIEVFKKGPYLSLEGCLGILFCNAWYIRRIGKEIEIVSPFHVRVFLADSEGHFLGVSEPKPAPLSLASTCGSQCARDYREPVPTGPSGFGGPTGPMAAGRRGILAAPGFSGATGPPKGDLPVPDNFDGSMHISELIDVSKFEGTPRIRPEDIVEALRGQSWRDRPPLL